MLNQNTGGIKLVKTFEEEQVHENFISFINDKNDMLFILIVVDDPVADSCLRVTFTPTGNLHHESGIINPALSVWLTL